MTITQPNFESKVDVSRFWRDGFLVMRDFFPTAYVSDLRERLFESDKLRAESGSPYRDLLADERLRDVVHHAAIVAAARQILGDNPVYFGDGNYSIVNENYQEYRDIGGYHRDNPDRSDMNAPDWRSRYTIVRFGIYLQDHHKYSGGILTVRKSHERMQRRREMFFNHRYLDTRVGDLAVWSMRTLHAGVGRFVRGMPWFPITQAGQKWVPAFLHAPNGPNQRAAIFVTYALQDAHLERYLRYLRTRSQNVDLWRNSVYDPTALEDCGRVGLEVLSMREQIMSELADGKVLGQNQHHRAIPY